MKLSFRLAGVWGFIALSASFAQAADLAKVNGKAITDGDLKSYLSNFNDSQRENVLSDDSGRQQVLNQVVNQELLFQQAQKEKLEDSADYKGAMETFKRQYLSGMIVNRKIEPQVTDSAAKKFYSAHAIRYSTGQVRVQHILVPTAKEAEQVMALVKKPGTDFQETAQKLSKDPSAKNNRGDLGFFPRGQYDDAFTDASFNGEKGEIVGPVHTSFGFHVIKIVDFKPGKNLEFDEVELRVRNDLRARLTQAFLDDLKKKNKVEFLR